MSATKSLKIDGALRRKRRRVHTFSTCPGRRDLDALDLLEVDAPGVADDKALEVLAVTKAHGDRAAEAVSK